MSVKGDRSVRDRRNRPNSVTVRWVSSGCLLRLSAPPPSTTGDPLAIYTEAEHPYAPIGEGRSVSVNSTNPGQTLIAVAVKGGISFYSLQDGMLLYTVDTESNIASLDWDSAGELLAAGSMDGTA